MARVLHKGNGRVWLLLLVFSFFLLALSACAPNTGLLGGGNWQESGLQHEHIRSLEVDPGNPQQLYAGDEQDGVFSSADAGAHWTKSSAGLPSPVFIHALSFDDSGKKLYAATDHGLYVSTDKARHWSIVGTTGSASGDLPADTYTSLAFDESAPHTIYTATMQHGVFVSTNDGTSWTPAGNGLPSGAAINGLTFDSNTHQLWVATTQGIYRSDDRGATWRTFNVGLPASLNISSIKAADSDGGARGLIYAGTNRGFFLSHDAGAHWAASQESLQGISITAILIDFRSTNATTVYVGTNVGAFRSDDSGDHWGGIAAGLPRGQPVYALLIGGLDNSQLYASTNALYMFPGSSGGLSFSHLLPLLLIAALFFLLYSLMSRSRRRSLLQANRHYEPEEHPEGAENASVAEPPPTPTPIMNVPPSTEESSEEK